MKQAVENMTVEVPDAMVEQMLDGMMREFHYNISSQGMDPNQYLQMMGMDAAALREGSRMTALARIQTGLLLDAVAEAEGLVVEEAEIEAEYARLAEQYQQEIELLKKGISAADLTEDIKRRRTAELIYGSAEAKKAEGEKKESPKKKAKPKDEAAEEVAPAEKAPAKKAPAKKAAAKKATEEKE